MLIISLVQDAPELSSRLPVLFAKVKKAEKYKFKASFPIDLPPYRLYTVYTFSLLMRALQASTSL